MRKHTDGPWQVNPLGEEFESGSIFADTLANGARRLIATVSIGPESPANAKLIAASPELLASCKALLERYRIMVAADGPEALEAARVIAKVES